MSHLPIALFCWGFQRENSGSIEEDSLPLRHEKYEEILLSRSHTHTHTPQVKVRKRSPSTQGAPCAAVVLLRSTCTIRRPGLLLLLFHPSLLSNSSCPVLRDLLRYSSFYYKSTVRIECRWCGIFFSFSILTSPLVRSSTTSHLLFSLLSKTSIERSFDIFSSFRGCRVHLITVDGTKETTFHHFIYRVL